MIEVRYIGRTGNQLFQYCIGRILAEHLGYTLVASPVEGFPGTSEHILGKKIESPEEVCGHSWYPDGTHHDGQHLINLSEMLANPQDRKIIVEGFFQRYEYYKPFKTQIRKWLTFSPPAYAAEISDRDVVVHVRSGEIGSEHCVKKSYYEEVLRSISYDRVFVATDDTQDETFRFVRDAFHAVYIEDTAVNHLAWMASFSTIVMSVSTFSWWAAFLSSADKIFFPIPSRGIWSSAVPTISLFVDDEERYQPVNCES